MRRIAILGAGAWGTALAIVSLRAGCEAQLVARRQSQAEAIARARENRDYLPGIVLPKDLAITADGSAAASWAEALLLAVPAQHLREFLTPLVQSIAMHQPLVLAAKGIERSSGLLLSDLLAELLPGRPLAVLSGPTFASEVAAGLPTAVALAAQDQDLARTLANALGSRAFRTYLSDDPLGAELAGAMKNVIAIACGIVAGRKLGENARAALVTRGLAEIGRLVAAKGGRSDTLTGLAGFGDLMLTCASMRSRNYSLGMALGEGSSLGEVLGSRTSVTEGVATAAAALRLAGPLGIEMPITAAVDAIVNRGADIDEEIQTLLTRPFKPERD